jgi:chromosome segregation ATPase
VPPFVPELDAETDTRYFPQDEDDNNSIHERHGSSKALSNRNFMGLHLPFVGYTFLRNNPLYNEGSMIKNAAKITHTAVEDHQEVGKYLQKLKLTEEALAQQKLKVVQLQSRVLEEEEKENALKDALTTEKRHCEELGVELGKTRKVLEALEDQSKAQNSQEEAQRKLFHDQVSQAQVARDAAVKECNRLQNLWSTNKSQMETLQAEVRNQKQKIDELNDQISSLHKYEETYRKDLYDCKVKLTELNSQISSAEMTSNNLKATLSSKERDVNRLQSELQNQINVAASQKHEVSNLIKKKTELEFELLATKKIITEQVHAQEEKVTNDIQLLQDDLIQTRNALSMETDKSQRLASQLEQEVSHVKEMASQLEDLNNIVSNLKTQARDQDMKMEELQHLLYSQECQVEEYRSKIRNLEENVEKNENRIVEKDQQITYLLDSLRIKGEEVVNSEETIGQLQLENSNLLERIHALDNAMHDKERRYTQLQDDFNAKVSKIKLQSEEIDHLQAKTKWQDKKILKMVEENHNYDSMSSIGTDKPAKRLKADYRDLLQRFSELQAKLSSTEKELHETRSQLTTATSRTNLSGVSPSPATPMSGDDARGSAFRRNSFLKSKKVPKDASACPTTEEIMQLRGWLKIPKKDGFIRHGWKKKFFSIREFKLLMWDKEREADTLNYQVIFDTRYPAQT